MTRDKIKEGDICTLDESVAYSYYPHKPYEVVVLWHGVNSQPLVTKLDAYKPFWTTYSQLIEVNRHIDLSIKAIEQQTCEDAVSREAVLGLFAQNADATRPYSTAWEKIRDLPPVNPQPKTGQFAKWVATEIFDDMWEYNKDSFAEIACRKLAKMGIVRAKGDKWELVEPQEKEE